MPLPDDPDAFESAFRAAVAAALPATTVERVDRTIIAIKLRVDLDEHRFIDVFFNAGNQRVDLAVIEHGQRIFGYTISAAGIATHAKHPSDTKRARSRPLRPSSAKL